MAKTLILLIAVGVAFTTPANAQQVQGGIAAMLGSAGLGGELEVSTSRMGAYYRLHFGLSTGTRIAGVRAYPLGRRSAGAYVSAALTELQCDRVDLGGASTNCDGEWHRGWALLGGVEFGEPNVAWSFFLEFGPYFGTRNVPGLRDWGAAAGARLRGPGN